MTEPKVDHAGETWSRNGGPGLGVRALVRTAYFLSPFLEFHYQPLYRSSAQVDLGRVGGLVGADRSLRTFGVLAGGAFDVWRLRLAAGIGEYRVLVRSTLNGQTTRTSEWDMGYLFSVAGFVWASDRFKLGLESRVGLITDAGTTFFWVGAVAAGDLLRW
jgi:hypothetical protein